MYAAETRWTSSLRENHYCRSLSLTAETGWLHWYLPLPCVDRAWVLDDYHNRDDAVPVILQLEPGAGCLFERV